MTGMLVGGSLYAALRKVLFQLTGPGLNGQVMMPLSCASTGTSVTHVCQCQCIQSPSTFG